MISLCFKFTRTQVFTIWPTVMLNIGYSSRRCLEKNTDVHQQIQTLIVKTDHLALKLGSKKINAIADDELHNFILNWSREPIILVQKWWLSCDAIFLPSNEILIQVTQVELYSTQMFVRGGKIEQNRKRTWEKKLFVPSLLLAVNECHGIMANVR